jgi:hypothetical protein
LWRFGDLRNRVYFQYLILPDGNSKDMGQYTQIFEYRCGLALSGYGVSVSDNISRRNLRNEFVAEMLFPEADQIPFFSLGS